MEVEEFDTTKLLAHAAQQAAERGYKNFPIVDVDSHHYESESIGEILEYMDDPVLQQLARSARQASAKSVGMLPAGVGYQDMGGRVMRYAVRGMEKTEPGVHRDIALTRRWMDAIGIDVAVMFPTPMLQLGLHPQVEVEVALARAYNRWLTERVLAHEPRIRSMLYLPFNDADAAFRMVQEFGQSKGVVGFMVTSARYRPVHHNSYMKTYALMEEMGLPLAFHAGYNWNDQTVGMMNRFISVHALGFVFYNMVHLANWITNGLPERFPKLKVLWVESGLAWVPFMMQRFDNEYMMRSSEAPALKKKPSDYMRDMYLLLAADGNDRHGGAGADLPHDQGGDPVALFVRLSALGFRPAVDDLRPAVPERAGQAQHSRRQCDEAVQSQTAGAKAGARRISRTDDEGGNECAYFWR